MNFWQLYSRSPRLLQLNPEDEGRNSLQNFDIYLNNRYGVMCRTKQRY